MGAIKYDRLIIDNYLAGKATDFRPDPVVSSLTFASQVIPETADICHGGSITKGVSSYTASRQPRKRRGTFQNRRMDEVPADFPPGVCFHYNYRQCWDENCSKAHICRKCSANHRADTCREKSKKS